MKNKRVIAAAALCLSAFIALAFLLSRVLSETPNSSQTGILNHNSGQETPAQTEERRTEAYQKRPVFPPPAELKLEERALVYLSSADFGGLDAWLQQLSSTYRDGTEEEADDSQVRYSSVIERYRADLALMGAISRNAAGDDPLTGFQEPDVLAAAVVYAPISAKFSAFLHQDSIMLPAVDVSQAGETRLEKAELSVQRQLELIGECNARVSEARYNEIHEYALWDYGLPMILHIVHTSDDRYLPYSLLIDSSATESAEGLRFDLPTVKDVREMWETAKALGLDFDPDSAIAVSGSADTEASGGEVPPFQIPEGFQPLTEPLDFQSNPT